MSITEKYNFKVSMDQFGNTVSSNWYDDTELIMLEAFEQAILGLPNKDHYTMVELGANQAYYSLLFKSILGKDKTTNIMVEPYEPYIHRAKHEFDLNSYKGIYINRGIGTKCQILGHSFDKPTTSLDELIKEFEIKELDCLQCDIDGAEFLMLEGANNSLTEGKINYLFVATHFGIDKHEEFKNKMNKFNYELILDKPNKIVGGDSLVIYKRK
jgi:hypothetical protein